MELNKEISDHFKAHEWGWSVSGHKVIPEPEDVAKVLDHAAELLYDEPIGTQLEVGRLIIRKESKGLDIYMMVGER